MTCERSVAEAWLTTEKKHGIERETLGGSRG
jgi:hypothetical protein